VAGDPGEAQVLIRDNVAYATIDLQQDDFDAYYNGYANSTLWPLFHYLVARSFRYSDEEHDAYQRVNRLMARRLAPLLEAQDLIWVHDYHLIPLARGLRELGVERPIGFFLHIPFPHIEMLRALPTYAELLQELVCYDVVGFQTGNDLRGFRSGVAHVWGEDALLPDGNVRVEGRVVRVDVFPISVDVQALQAAAEHGVGTEAVKRFIRSLQGRQLIIGVDRLDYSKGLVERVTAYQRFLETHPDKVGQVTFMQIAPLSRGDVRAYAEIRAALEQASGRINGQFATADWTPIRYLNRNFPHSALMGYLRAARVGLVTPVRDGMNLVAKEFVVAQDPADPGVLILSPLAGAACELTGALQINPYDTRGLAHAMQAALTMPLQERRRRYAAMMQVIRRNDIGAWHQRFTAALSAVAAPAPAAASGAVPASGKPSRASSRPSGAGRTR
jgi:trehalose 6-phosphate synthase